MLDIILNISIVILILSVLVFVHELGHLIAAKLINAKVFEFAIGFGPKLFSKYFGETEYSIRALPLGGYVNILGETHDEELESKDPKRSLRNKSGIQKIFVMIAGVTMNFILAVIIYFFLLLSVDFKMPISSELKDFSPLGAKITKEVVGEFKYTSLIDDLPAKRSGMLDKGIIKSIDGEDVDSLEFRNIISEKKGKEIVLNACDESGNSCKDYNIKVGDDGKIGIYITDNVLFYMDYSENKLFSGVTHSINYIRIVGMKLSDVFGNAKYTGDYSEVVGGVSGPVGLYLIVDQLKEYGVVLLVEITASLSLTLVITNLLPIPALDGGRILLVIIEMIIRKPLNKKIEALVINISFILLMILMFSIIIKDIVFFNDIKELIESMK